MKTDHIWKGMDERSGCSKKRKTDNNGKAMNKYSCGNPNEIIIDCSISSSSKREEEENIREHKKMKVDDNWKSMSKGSSGSIFDDYKILCEVLSRLPVKSLMRFKCVSKHWQFSICQDLGLIDLHSTRSKQYSPVHFIVVPRLTKVNVFERTIHKSSSKSKRKGHKDRMPNSGFKSLCKYGGVREYKYQRSILLANLFECRTLPASSSAVTRLEDERISFYYTEILNPLNGLICFVNRCKAAVCILNPSTRESTGWISSSLRTDKRYNFAAEYECGVWVPTYSFGFDPATRRHKVVCTWRVHNNPRINICELLTVGETNWRRINAEVPFSYCVQVYVYANGFIYWGNKSVGIPEFLDAFDVGCEKFTVIRVPKEVIEKYIHPPELHCVSFNSLIEVGGHVGLLQRWTSNMIKLWRCTDNASICSYSSWTEMTLELPFQWDDRRSVFFHGVPGADQIIIESNPRVRRADIKEVSLYSYDLEKKRTTAKVKSGVVSKLVSVSLCSKLETVSLFSYFAESIWPVRKDRIRHNQDIEEVRLRLNLDVTAARDSAPAPAPIESFTEMCLHESIMKDIAFHEYTRPTSIQAQAMPVALNGRDLLSCAESGSGKTAAFAIPMIQHCVAQPSVRRGDGPLALVLSPTREHAQQIEKKVKSLSRSLESFRTAIAVGGENMAEQRSELRAGVSIVVATPGSFIDHLQQGNTCLSRISFVVLDEADRMLDMGFEPQIREVMRNLPVKHQTLMFSATLTVEIEALVQEYLTDPVQVIVGRARRVRSSRRTMVP